MDILVVCHYGLYQDLNASFVHNQVREYVRLGHRVRVIIPIGVGKQDGAGRRLAPLLDRCEADGVELYYLRYVTLSHWGERGAEYSQRLQRCESRVEAAVFGFSTPGDPRPYPGV